MAEVVRVENFVDGVAKAASSHDVMDVVDPSTGEQIAVVTASSAEDVDVARSRRGSRPARVECADAG